MTESSKPREWCAVKKIVYEWTTTGQSSIEFHAKQLGHVIEYSAYDALKKENEITKELLQEARTKGSEWFHAYDQINTKLTSAMEMLERAEKALDFYAGYWGPHHGNDDRTNSIIQETLNRARFKAEEALADLKRWREEK